MAKSRIGLNFSIKDFPISKNYDLRINCREEFNYLRYGSNFGESNVGVSYLTSTPINVRDNLILEDLTGELNENSSRITTEEYFTEQNFEVVNGKFLMTDVFRTTSAGDEVPLYKRHNLNDWDNISQIEVLNGEFEPVNPDLYLYLDESATLLTETRSIYTNLESSYDSVENSYTVYYVRFTDNNTGRQVVELLNPVPFYVEAGFTATARDRVYRLTASNESTEVEVWFNSLLFSPTPPSSNQRFAVKTTGSNKIKIIKPIDLPAVNRWYLRVNLGEFYRNTGVPGERLRYYVPEYFGQFFSPVPPFKLSIEQRGRTLDNYLLQIEPSPIANLEIDGFYIYIALKDSIGRTVRALTNDPGASAYITPEGKVTNVFYEKDTIDSMAVDTGFIRLNTSVATDLTPYITYRYNEQFYTYRGLSVNSTINPTILNKRILMYVVPERLTTINRSVYHLLVDDNGNIVESAENENFQTYSSVAAGGDLNSIQDPSLSDSDIYTSYEVEIVKGRNAGRKLKITSYDEITKTLFVTVPFDNNIEAGDEYRINKKANDYSTFDSVSGTTFDYDGWLTTYTAAPHYYVALANVYPIQTIAPADVQDTDIRLRGGGIKEQFVNDALDLQDEVQWYWDIGYWDGKPYPGMAAIIVEIPRQVLQEVGGAFTREQVESAVREHMAEGSYPVIRYYDRSTKILSLNPGNTEVNIEWQDVGASLYNLYVGIGPESLQLYRTYNGAITEAVVEGLENNKTYYFRVVSVVAGVEQLPSRTVFAIPYDPSTVKPGAVYGVTIFNEGTYQS
jgi:hypothetical protein